MTKSREKLVALAEKKRRSKSDRLTKRWQKRTLREVRKVVKREARKGRTFSCTIIDLNKVDNDYFKTVIEAVGGAVHLLENKGYHVHHHDLLNTLFSGREYIIKIDLLEKPILKTKES